MEGSGGTTERPFPLDDVLGVLGGEAEASADWAVVTVRRSHWGGRTFEVQVDGALAYLHSYLPKARRQTPRMRVVDEAVTLRSVTHRGPSQTARLAGRG